MNIPPLILASASPRRRALIAMIAHDVDIIPSKADESISDDVPLFDRPASIALKKARYIAQSYPDRLVIGCDTAVFYGEQILGKPSSKADARKMLSMLSGKTHSVITGCALILGENVRTFSELTQVMFYELSHEEINAYIDTGEPMDKAGSYGIQGKGALFVKEIRGDYYNVVGLPVSRLKRETESFCNSLIKK